MTAHVPQGAPNLTSPVPSPRLVEIRREIGDEIDGVLLSEPGIPGADIAAWICTHYVIRERP